MLIIQFPALFQQTVLKKKFCMQSLIFCVYNVVLDILILDFFSFSEKRLKQLFSHNFFQKRLKLPFLV